MPWLAEQIAAGWTVLMHSTKFFLFVCFMLFAGIGCYVVYQKHNPGVLPDLPVTPGQVQPATPPPPPAPAPVTPAIEAVSISIHGPQPAIVIDGVSTLFMAETTGPAGTPKWRTLPAAAGTIRKTSADGRRAEFLSSGPGKCTVLVDVAGDGRQLATDAIELEVVSVGEEPAPHDPNPVPPAPPMPQQPQTVAQLVTGALANVNSSNRKAEAAKVASVLSALIGRIEGGALPPNTDPMDQIRTQLSNAMGADSGKWEGFLTSFDAIIQQLRTQGAIVTIADAVQTLQAAATVLRSSP